jgi:hypothetical protein
VNLQPQLASVTFATNNPTLTTVALEKPLCMFDSSEPLSGSYEVYLYAMVDSGKGPASLQKRHLTVYGEEGESGGWDIACLWRSRMPSLITALTHTDTIVVVAPDLPFTRLVGGSHTSFPAPA